MQTEPLDCLIIGAGPAGLTAALYLSRYLRNISVVDAGHSRAALIPVSHNYPGFPDGVSGASLLQRLRDQASRYGVRVRNGEVTELLRGDDFVAAIGTDRVRARTVLLATGVLDRQPDVASSMDMRAATLAGLVRWCPVCDGYEALDRNVGLIAPVECGPAHAIFLRSYSRQVTWIVSSGDETLAAPERRRLRDVGIHIQETPMAAMRVVENQIAVDFVDGSQSAFDTLYPMLGITAQSSFATALGADCDENRELIVDAHQQTTVPGLYAAGDMVRALNQMAVGMAHAATAATAIHNALGRIPR